MAYIALFFLLCALVAGVVARHRDIHGPGEWAGIPWYVGSLLLLLSSLLSGGAALLEYLS
jgi:hypothetical protein